MFWFCLVSFPLVVLAHRFSVNMGHGRRPDMERMSPLESWRDALHCAKGAGVVCIVLAALYLSR